MSREMSDKELETILSYDTDGLRKAILKAEENIQRFEDAIAKERETISTYNTYISLKRMHRKS